jgi:CHAT domain-containing protein
MSPQSTAPTRCWESFPRAKGGVSRPLGSDRPVNASRARWICCGAVSRMTIVALALCGLWSTDGQSPPIAREAGKLQLHQPVERELGPGQTDVFSVDIAAGQFLHVVVQKKGVDAVLSIVDPSGKPLVTADSPNSTLGPQPASAIAEAPGIYSVKVAKSGRTKETGKYVIELTDLGEPSERNQTQVQAETKLYAAAAKERAGTGESRLAAIRQYEEAVSLWRELGDRYGEALCIFRIGVAYYDLGEQQKALDHLQQALPLRRAAGDRSGEALTLTYIAAAYLTLGEPQKALDTYQQMLSIQRAINDRSGEAFTLTYMAGVYFTNLGEQQKALDAYQQALSIQRAIGDRSGEARTLAYIGNQYGEQGAAQTALDYYQQALTIARVAGDHTIENNLLLGFGFVYCWLGEKQKALDSYQQALTLTRSAGDRGSEAVALVGIANALSNLGDRQKPDNSTPADKRKALEYYRQCLSIARATGNRLTEVYALIGAGVASSALGEKQKALDYLNPALFLVNVARNQIGIGWTMYEKARVERDLGNLAEAHTLASRVLEIIESLRSRMISQDLRAQAGAVVQEAYGLEMDILMRLHAADPSKNHLADALTVSERARARILLETLSESRADIQQGVDVSLLARERTVEAQLNAKEMTRIQMLGSKHTPDQLADIEKAVKDLATEYEDLHTQIRARSPRYAALNFPQPLSLNEIQKEVLDPDTLLLEYALGEQRSFLWAVSSSAIDSVELAKRSDIEQAARLFHDALVDSAAIASPDAGKILSKMLLGGISAKLGNKRLLIVADGALQYLPFAALPDPDGFQQPLIVNHEIVSVPSASTLAVLRRENAGRKPAPKMLAVLADPVFSAEDARISHRQEKEQGKQVAAVTRDADELQRSLNDLGLSGFRLPRLPGTRREAAGIMALVPEDQRKQALDFDANRNTLTSPEMGQYRILHLATHGLLNTAHPELSGVVLSLVDRRGQPQDGFLRLHEIYNLKLSADLVVLSACQTGLGKEIQGEGLVGLTRGFMYAGAPRVLASLWKVDDRATAELMKHFYGAMLGDKHQRPAAALREAQIAMWKTKGWEAPYYWAAFVLQGDWK